MNKIRKITAISVSFVLIMLSMLSICAYADTSQLRYFERGVLSDGTYTAYYIIDKDNRVLYLAGDGCVNGATPDYPSADQGPFAGRTDVTKIVIEEDVERIGDYVFANMTAVDTLEIQSNIITDSSMSSKAMIGCTGLRTVKGNSSLLSTDVLLQVIKGAINAFSGNWLSLAMNGFNIIKTGVSGNDDMDDELVYAMINDYITTGDEVYLDHIEVAINGYNERISSPCYYENAYHHTYTSYVTVPVSCTACGRIAHTCSICGASYTEDFGIPTGHHYSEEVLWEPTCTKEGVKKCTCDDCGDTTFALINAKGHTDGEWEVTVEATYASNGTKVLHCADCGEIIDTATFVYDKDTVYTYMTGIDLSANSVNDIKTLLGAASLRISVERNGRVLDASELVGTGSQVRIIGIANGKLYELSTVVVYGDITGDGKINSKDYSQVLAKYMGKTSTITSGTVVEQAADVNRDGVLDAFDLAQIDLQMSGEKAINQSPAI